MKSKRIRKKTEKGEAYNKTLLKKPLNATKFKKAVKEIEEPPQKKQKKKQEKKQEVKQTKQSQKKQEVKQTRPSPKKQNEPDKPRVITQQKIKQEVDQHDDVEIQDIQDIEDDEDDYIEVIRDENDKIFEDLYYEDDEMTELTRDMISKYPENFLPDIFKGLVPYLQEKNEETIKVQVSLDALSKGIYHTEKSKSDEKISKGIRTLLKTTELNEYNQDDLTDLIKNHRKVFYTILKRGLTLKHSISTIKSYIVYFIRLLFIAFNNKKPPIYVKYAILMKNLGDAHKKADDDNALNENEEGRFIDFSYVLREQKEIQVKFNNLKNKLTNNAYDINQSLILVSLYSLIPPLRKEVMALCFKKQGDDDNSDYVYFKKNETVLQLNLTKKRHGKINIPVSKELEEILKQSYSLYPRKYLFTDARKYPNMDKPLTIASVGNRLRKLFIKFAVNVGPSILRASYVTYRCDQVNWRLTMAEAEKMAILMRTSSKYIMTSYRKIIKKNKKDDVVNAIAIGEDNIPLVKPEPIDSEHSDFDENSELDESNDIGNVHNQFVKEDPYVKNNEYLKKKYKENQEYKDKLLKQQKEYKQNLGSFEVRRRKIISMIKNSQEYRKAVKQDTLTKYGIVLSDYI